MASLSVGIAYGTLREMIGGEVGIHWDGGNQRGAGMKATGIVRRIDDLGRVVIPKRSEPLRIREGDPLEIFVDREGEVILKKYCPLGMGICQGACRFAL